MDEPTDDELYNALAVAVDTRDSRELRRLRMNRETWQGIAGQNLKLLIDRFLREHR